MATSHPRPLPYVPSFSPPHPQSRAPRWTARRRRSWWRARSPRSTRTRSWRGKVSTASMTSWEEISWTRCRRTRSRGSTTSPSSIWWPQSSCSSSRHSLRLPVDLQPQTARMARDARGHLLSSQRDGRYRGGGSVCAAAALCVLVLLPLDVREEVPAVEHGVSDALRGFSARLRDHRSDHRVAFRYSVGSSRRLRRSPLTAVIPMMGVVLMALKGHSFILTNYSLEKQSTEPIPNSFGHYLYFMYSRSVCST